MRDSCYRGGIFPAVVRKCVFLLKYRYFISLSATVMAQEACLFDLFFFPTFLTD